MKTAISIVCIYPRNSNVQAGLLTCPHEDVGYHGTTWPGAGQGPTASQEQAYRCRASVHVHVPPARPGCRTISNCPGAAKLVDVNSGGAVDIKAYPENAIIWIQEGPG